MPELPEVEAARLALEEHTKGKLIVRAVVAEDTTVINGVSSLDLQQALTGKRIENVSRKGKNMWLELDERPWPSFQFGRPPLSLVENILQDTRRSGLRARQYLALHAPRSATSSGGFV